MPRNGPLSALYFCLCTEEAGYITRITRRAALSRAVACGLRERVAVLRMRYRRPGNTPRRMKASPSLALVRIKHVIKTFGPGCPDQETRGRQAQADEVTTAFLLPRPLPRRSKTPDFRPIQRVQAITGIAGCCARATSGNARAAPPRRVISSRRLISSMGLPPSCQRSPLTRDASPVG